MKKKIFISFYMLVMAVLLIGPPLQAQNWANHDMTTMFSNMITYAQNQVVRPYHDEYIINVATVPINGDCNFNIWKNGSNLIEQMFMNQTGFTISDFTILGDTLYFCGKKLNNQNNYDGVIGKMSMAALLSGNNIQYNMTTINNTQNLTKLVAYYADTNDVCVFAIGDNGVSNLTPGRVVLLRDSVGAPNLTINVMPLPPISNTTKEILHDICLSGNVVITLSHVYPSNQYIVRYFKRDISLVNFENYIYSLPNTIFNTMSDCYGYGLHISDVEQNVLAVAVSASQNNNYFTIINLLERFNSTVLSSQAIVHENKDHKVLEMEYSDALHKLLILHNNYFENISQKQTLCRLSPIYSSSDTLFLEYLQGGGQLNHFSIIPNQRCASVGIMKNIPQSNQLLTVRKLELDNNVNCFNSVIGKVIVMNFPNGNIFINTPPVIQIPQMTWGVYNGSNLNDNVYIDCED